MGRRPLSEWIAEQDRFARLKPQHFRRGAEVVAAAKLFAEQAIGVAHHQVRLPTKLP